MILLTVLFCILKKQATEVILVGSFRKCQSIKKVGGRRFVGLYQALFSFRLARQNVIYKAKRKLSLIPGYHRGSFLVAVFFSKVIPLDCLGSLCKPHAVCHTLIHPLNCAKVFQVVPFFNSLEHALNENSSFRLDDRT